MSGGGSLGGKGVGSARGKGGKKGGPIVWEGSLGPEFYDEPVFEFPLESKRDFNHECPLRGYDSRKEDWPRCRHGLDCVVQMCTDENDGAVHRFFRCPKGWALLVFYILFFEIFFMFCEYL